MTGYVDDPQLSGDGRAVIYYASAQALKVSHDNFTRVVYRNLRGGAAKVISGQAPEDHSFADALSADGGLLAFTTISSTLLADGADTNGVADVFVRNAATDQAIRISTSTNGTQANGGSSDASMNFSGTRIAFSSVATNLTSDGAEGAHEVYVRDLGAGTTERVSIIPIGDSACACSSPHISGEGDHVGFNCFEPYTYEVDCGAYVRDLTSGTLATVCEGNRPGTSGVGCLVTSISGDGRYVVLSSSSPELVAGDTNDEPDVFVKDMVEGTFTRVSVSSAGGQANGPSWADQDSSISANGRYVVFSSDASNLIAKDSNDARDVFLHDRAMGTTIRVSEGPDGQEGDNESSSPSLSADGRFLVFKSAATNFGAETQGTGQLWHKRILP